MEIRSVPVKDEEAADVTGNEAWIRDGRRRGRDGEETRVAAVPAGLPGCQQGALW